MTIMTINNDLKSIPLNLNALIDYQEHSIVSKHIVKTDIHNITVFSFDAHELISEHTTPFDAIILAIDGELEVTISGNKSLLYAQDMIIMPAYEPHAVYAKKKSKMMLIMLKELKGV